MISRGDEAQYPSQLRSTLQLPPLRYFSELTLYALILHAICGETRNQTLLVLVCCSLRVRRPVCDRLCSQLPYRTRHDNTTSSDCSGIDSKTHRWRTRYLVLPSKIYECGLAISYSYTLRYYRSIVYVARRHRDYNSSYSTSFD